MSRPREPAAILELRGAFRANPQRRRQDAEGAGAFQPDPPAHLPQDIVPAWTYVVARVPKIALSSSDEVLVEEAAALLAGLWSLRARLGALAVTTAEHGRMAALLLRHLEQLGMTPRGRASFTAAATDKPASTFDALKHEDGL